MLKNTGSLAEDNRYYVKHFRGIPGKILKINLHRFNNSKIY